MSTDQPTSKASEDEASLYEEALTGKALVPVSPERMKRDEKKVKRGFWPKVRTTIGKVPFIEDAVAGYYCATDRKTPVWVRATLMGALAYFVVPTDMIPDIIAGLGFTDDATVVLAALRAISGHLNEEHRTRARYTLSDSEELEAADMQRDEAPGA